MQCAEKVQIQGNAPGKLKTRFGGEDLPATVMVQGSNPPDQQKVTPSGNWISQKTYSFPVVLQLYDSAGNMVKTCSYDGNGNLITNGCQPNVCNALFSTETGSEIFCSHNTNGTVDITLLMSTASGSECLVLGYQLQSLEFGSFSFTDVVGAYQPYNAGNGGVYVFPGVAEAPIGTVFRVRVEFTPASGCTPIFSSRCLCE